MPQPPLKGGFMKKFIVISVIMVVTLYLGIAFFTAQAQDTTKDDKPTFYRLTPGVYVNPWPRFTVTYPKSWVEHRPFPGEVFRAGIDNPAGLLNHFHVVLNPISFEFDMIAPTILRFAKTQDQNATLVSDKPSQLRDGTPAREVEIHYLRTNGIPINWLDLCTKKGTLSTICIGVISNEKIGGDLKAIVYSLEFQPGKDELVMVPPDVQEFIDKWCSDIVSHDVAKVVAHYSERYLNSGMRKDNIGQYFRRIIDSITSFEVGITEFVPAGDRAYLAGFASNNWGKTMLTGTSIIKENGEWKWYGNQRDPAPSD
jgi:hypothetical protein